jgi:phage shock protein E
MSWTYFLIVLVVAIVYISFKHSGQVPKKDAHQYLKSGALVIDVRSPNEFNSGHLLQAYNMPLDRIEMLLPGTVRDKNKVLLLHCTTGIRSNMAKRKLLDLGYKNVFNLGSYERAEKIVSGRYL